MFACSFSAHNQNLQKNKSLSTQNKLKIPKILILIKVELTITEPPVTRIIFVSYNYVKYHTSIVKINTAYNF
jgi:hypothetical protein